MSRCRLATVLSCLAVAALAATAPASVITFDDLPVGYEYGSDEPSTAPIPDGYGELHWSDSFYVMDTSMYLQDNGPSGYSNCVVSGTQVAFNAYGDSVWVDDGSTFDFTSVWLGAAWNDDLNITVEGYLGDVLLYSTTVVAQYAEPQEYYFYYAGIDRISFYSWGGTDHDPSDFVWGDHFVMDDMVINDGYVPISNVPAPAAVASLMMGLACLAGCRRYMFKA